MIEIIFIPPNKISDREADKVKEFTFANQIRAELVYFLAGTSVDRTGFKLGDHLSKESKLTVTEMNSFIERYRNDPKEIMAKMRIGLVELVRDKKRTQEVRKKLLNDYLEQFLELIPKFDRIAFPPTGENHVYSGVPAYIPDGLSDMGSQPQVENAHRTREKIRVDKSRSYALSKKQLGEAIWALKDSHISPSAKEVKLFLTKMVMAQVFNEMPYRRDNQVGEDVRSIRIDEYLAADSDVSVCRHIAMETQLRLQALGIESRLLKCTLDGEAHVANLVRIEGQWFLIDTTNPEAPDTPQRLNQPFLQPIQNIDVPNASWSLFAKYRKAEKVVSKIRTYVPRKTMYYRIINNG